jgi:hypothetical protein
MIDPVGNYEDRYMIWTTLRKERGQEVLEFTNTFHTLHIELGIKESDRHFTNPAAPLFKLLAKEI